MLEAAKTTTFMPVSTELLIDALPFWTHWMNDGDKATEYLRLGQYVTLGFSDGFNPALTAEDLEGFGAWDLDWPTFLPYPDEY